MRLREIVEIADGIYEEIYTDDLEGTATLNTWEDAEPILAMNAKARNLDAPKHLLGDWHHIARVPATLWHRWSLECGGEDVLLADNCRELLKRLQNRDWNKLKTTDKTLI
jgi:hypothetical protein